MSLVELTSSIESGFTPGDVGNKALLDADASDVAGPASPEVPLVHPDTPTTAAITTATTATRPRDSVFTINPSWTDVLIMPYGSVLLELYGAGERHPMAEKA
ncbi:hypothetical protein GCM10009619_09550 [Williamsia maris]